jgi:hypothetical protein
MIITSHVQKINQIYSCLFKLSRKQESVMDGQTDRRTDGRYYYIPHRYHGGIQIFLHLYSVNIYTFCKSTGINAC